MLVIQFVFLFLIVIFSLVKSTRALGGEAPWATLNKLLFYSLFPDTNPPGFNQYAGLLNKYIPYFRLLSDKEQRLFVSRLRYVRTHKRFVGRGMVLSDEMEILASASLTQLTFGLTQFDLPGLREIHFTPETFYSRLVENNVKGLTFSGGRTILSWADFLQGYEVGNDQLNVGLHELSHSLWMHHNGTSSIVEHFNEWNVEAVRELQKMRNGAGQSFLRNYASTNIEEFWACSVECFFETPVEFKNAIPDLYTRTSAILRQDMAARAQAYATTGVVQV